MRAAVFHNPHAGLGEAPLDWMLEQLASANIPADVFSVPVSPDTLHHLHPDTSLLVLIGGNGTVRHILTQLPGLPIPVLLIPAGTANNIAHSLKVAELPEHITFEEIPELISFDFGKTDWKESSSFFLESAGCGIIARMMHLMQLRQRQHPDARQYQEEKYDNAMYTMWEITKNQTPRHCRLELDGRNYSGEYLFVECMNINMMGQNMILAPDADFGDGRLDVVLLHPEHRRTFERYLSERLNGKTPALKLETYRCQNARLQWEGPNFHIDGETFKNYDKPVIELSVQPRALHFMHPSKKEPSLL